MAAVLSRMPFKAFMAQLMLSAKPIEAGSTSTCTNPAPPERFPLQPQGPASVGEADSLTTTKGSNRSRCETPENKAFLGASLPIFAKVGHPTLQNMLKTRRFTP